LNFPYAKHEMVCLTMGKHKDPPYFTVEKSE
jgi:hypothetical protein